MSSILTNVSAMSGLNALRGINNDLSTTQERISSGLKVQSGADNAAYFSISETMKGDNSMLASIEEGMTLTRNSVSTARLGAEAIVDFARQITDKVAFAQAQGVDRAKVQEEIDGLVAQMATTVSQSTFNGDDLVNAANVTREATAADETAGLGTEGDVIINEEADFSGKPAAPASETVITGVSRGGGSFGTTEISYDRVDLAQIVGNFAAIDLESNDTDVKISGGETMTDKLANAEKTLGWAIDMATSLGVAEKSIENQQNFLGKLQDNFSEGVGSMVDANMEEEAAKLKSLQVQQQLANTALSISNSAPQQLLSLFR